MEREEERRTSRVGGHGTLLERGIGITVARQYHAVSLVAVSAPSTFCTICATRFFSRIPSWLRAPESCPPCPASRTITGSDCTGAAAAAGAGVLGFVGKVAIVAPGDGGAAVAGAFCAKAGCCGLGGFTRAVVNTLPSAEICG